MQSMQIVHSVLRVVWQLEMQIENIWFETTQGHTKLLHERNIR